MLREAGIVGSERQGLWAYYYVNPEALEELSGWLSVTERGRDSRGRPRALRGRRDSVDEGRVACCGPSRPTRRPRGPCSCGCGTDVPDACGGETFGAGLYAVGDRDELPDAAKLASLGCGNPTAVAELHEGETVLDLGSGGGIDVLLSARRVGPERQGLRRST